MCQKCTAPGPATGSLYLTISQTVLSAEREKGKGRKRECVCCAVHAQVLQLFWGPETTHTMHTHHTQPHTQGALWSVGSFALRFYLFQWFGNKRSHGSSAKRCHLGAILCRTPASTPPSAWAISGFVDCLTNCQQQRRRLWSKLFALQTSVRIRVRFALLFIVVFAHLPPHSLSLSCCCAVRHWQVMHDFRAIADLSVSDIANKMLHIYDLLILPPFPPSSFTPHTLPRGYSLSKSANR